MLCDGHVAQTVLVTTERNTTKSFFYKENQMTEQSVVKIIGFITNPIREFHAPIPENYLEESEVPSSLLNELKAHGWQDSKGILWWDTDFRPDPVKGPTVMSIS